MRPSDAVLHQGELYIADLKSYSVLVLDPVSGRVLRRLGRTPDGRSRLGWPTALAIGPRGRLYVTDTLNARVNELDREGQIVRVIGTLGTGIGQLVRPKGVAADRQGRVYVADAASQVVQIFDPSGPSMTANCRLTFDAETRTIARDRGSWLSDGFQPGMRIQIVGSSKNDGSYRIAPASDAVSDKTLQLTDVAKLTSEGPTEVTVAHSEARLLLFFGGAGPSPGDMSLPSRVTISYEGIEHFARYASPDFEIEYLIFVSNTFDAVKKVAVYGSGTYTGVVPAEQGEGRGVAPASKADREPGDSTKDGPASGAGEAAGSERRNSP
jgi:DNA-binding beta-propeller fold protein YncE